VLFLFVVMMLDIDFAELRAGFVKNFPLGMLVAVVLACEMVLGIGAYRAGALELGTPDGAAAPLLDRSNIESIGALLYGKYLFLFETAGMILLVAMVGAIVLTLRSRGDTRTPRARRQLRRHPDSAIRNTDPGVGEGMTL
jgi:NADH-quinone oxidoreductase subunit J